MTDSTVNGNWTSRSIRPDISLPELLLNNIVKGLSPVISSRLKVLASRSSVIADEKKLIA